MRRQHRPTTTTAAATEVAAAVVVSDGFTNMRRRSLIERFDLAPCYTVADGGSCWIVRCRHCSAGWLPSKSGRDVPDLVEHAQQRHHIQIRRRPRVTKTIVRLLVIRIDGRRIKTIRDRVSLARAAIEQNGAVTIECSYPPIPPAATPGLTPAATPGVTLLATDGRAVADAWAAGVDAWRRRRPRPRGRGRKGLKRGG